MALIKGNYSKTKVFIDKTNGASERLIFSKSIKEAFRTSVIAHAIEGIEINGEVILQEVKYSYKEGFSDLN